MGGRAGRRRDLFALQVGYGLDRIVAHPELGSAIFDVVHKKNLALAARGKIRNDRAGGQHIEAAAYHGLKDLKARGEHDGLQFQAMLGIASHLQSQPQVPVDSGRMQVADAQLLAGLADDGRGDSRDGRGNAGLEYGSAVQFHGVSLCRRC